MAGNGREDLNGKMLEPCDLIAYQEGSVVSRMLVYKPQGTITLFAFDAGEGLLEHTAPFDAIATILEGKARITIGGTEHHLTKGQMIIMPASIPHAVDADERFKMLLMMIHS